MVPILWPLLELVQVGERLVTLRGLLVSGVKTAVNTTTNAEGCGSSGGTLHGASTCTFVVEECVKPSPGGHLPRAVWPLGAWTGDLAGLVVQLRTAISPPIEGSRPQRPLMAS